MHEPKILTQFFGLAMALQPSADRYDGNPATDVFNMRNYGAICFLLQEGAGGLGTATLTVEACDNAAGANPLAIPFKYNVSSNAGALTDIFGALLDATAAGYLTIAGANKMVAVHVSARDLPDAKPFVRMQITEGVNQAVAAGVTAILMQPRVRTVPMPTAIV